MKCPNCGTEINDSATFCGKCGTEILRPKVKKGPSKGLNTAILILLGIFVVVVGIFFIANASITSYRSVAKNYNVAMKEGKYAEAYQYLDTQDSVFLTKEAFLDKESVYREIMASSDWETKLKTLGKKAFDYVTSKFAKMNYKVLEAKKDGDNAAVTFQLNSSYDKFKLVNMYETVQLKKSGHRHMGIFTDWRVVDDSVIAENVTLKIPACEKAYIDGIEIPSSYIKEQDNEFIIYTIPGLFTGNHVCTISKNGSEYKNYNIATNRSNAFVVVADVSLTEEEQQQVINDCYNAFKGVIAAQCKGADFKEVAGYFVPAYAKQEQIAYDTSKKKFLATDGTGGIQTVNITDVTGSVNNVAFTDGTLEVSVELNYTDSNTGKLNTYIFGVYDGSDDDNARTQVINMERKDGKWLISSFGENRVAENIWFF